MKLYCEPSATTCRPVLLFAADHDVDLEIETVSLSVGEHLTAAFAAINPNRRVPVLEDGDFRLTECSAILKYLAEIVQSPAYPQELRLRARVNEAMDWFNTGFYHDFGYGVVYPQLLSHHRLPTPELQAEVLQLGLTRSQRWLTVLNDHMIGDDGMWLCGPGVTLADYLGSSIVTLGELVGFDLSPYPNIRRWLDAMAARPGWKNANAAFYGVLSAVQERARRSA